MAGWRQQGTPARVAGFLVGHASAPGASTGCTVVLCPPGAVGGMEARGPGTRAPILALATREVFVRPARVLIAAILLALATAWPCPAVAWQIQIKEWGGGAQYSSDLSPRHHNLQSTGILTYLASPIWDGSSLRLEARLEGQVAKFWNYGTGVELALVPSLRLYLHSGHPRGPSLYGEAGVGPSYNTLNITELGLGFNFLSFAGLGLRLPLADAMSLDLGYRLRHISNAGLDDTNGGVSSHQFLLELGWQY